MNTKQNVHKFDVLNEIETVVKNNNLHKLLSFLPKDTEIDTFSPNLIFKRTLQGLGIVGKRVPKYRKQIAKTLIKFTTEEKIESYYRLIAISSLRQNGIEGYEKVIKQIAHDDPDEQIREIALQCLIEHGVKLKEIISLYQNKHLNINPPLKIDNKSLYIRSDFIKNTC